MSLSACISRCPTTTRSPVVGELARAGERLEHRRLCLLDLQEQRVVPSRPEQQRDPRPRADAADADHLAGEVGELELVEQMPAVGRQRVAVGAEHPPQYPAGSARAFAPCASRRSGRSAVARRRSGSSPSTTCVSLRERLTCCPWCAPWPSPCASPFTDRGVELRRAYLASTVSTSKRAYQTSRLPIRANSRHRVPVGPTTHSSTARR